MQRSFTKIRASRTGGGLASVLLLLFIVGLAEAQPRPGYPGYPRMVRLPAVDGPANMFEGPQNGPPELLESPQETLSEVQPLTSVRAIPEHVSGAPEAVSGPVAWPAWVHTGFAERANLSQDGQQYLGEYGTRIETDVEGQDGTPVEPIPEDFDPWWDQLVRTAQTPSLHMSIDQLTSATLNYSSYVQVVATDPEIIRTGVLEEEAAFDWRAFLESTYNDVNEPIGNTLTTGTDATRFKDRTWSADFGLRQDNRLGGSLELAQRYGSQRNNSRFLLPNPQATSQLELRYTQPLLNGAGWVYNESRIVLAEIQTGASSDKVVQELEELLFKVTEAYWDLYRTRAEHFQRRKALLEAEETEATLASRKGVDAAQRQLLRARTAVATRRAELVRTQTSIRNAESQLRLLVNDPVLVHAGGQEFLPVEAPMARELPLELHESLYTALQSRPDISQAIREIRASAVRMGVAQKELLPQLDVIASTYVAGLAGGNNIGTSFGNQFNQGRPSYSVGMVLEAPLGRRAALAVARRQELEMRRAVSRFRLTVEEALTEVEVAVREVRTNYRETAAMYRTMVAAAEESAYLLDRWKSLPSMDESAVLLLENLLDAQERVADEETAMVRSQVRYALSIVRLKQKVGRLLIYTPAERID